MCHHSQLSSTMNTLTETTLLQNHLNSMYNVCSGPSMGLRDRTFVQVVQLQISVSLSSPSSRLHTVTNPCTTSTSQDYCEDKNKTHSDVHQVLQKCCHWALITEGLLSASLSGKRTSTPLPPPCTSHQGKQENTKPQQHTHTPNTETQLGNNEFKTTLILYDSFVTLFSCLNPISTGD